MLRNVYIATQHMFNIKQNDALKATQYIQQHNAK